MPSTWQHYRRTADQLRHLLDNREAAAALTSDEADWAALLRDRLYELHNRRPTHEV